MSHDPIKLHLNAYLLLRFCINLHCTYVLQRPHSLTPSNGTTDNSHASEDDEPLMIPKNQPRKLSIGTTVGPVPPGELTNLEKLVHPQVRKILSVESGSKSLVLTYVCTLLCGLYVLYSETLM